MTGVQTCALPICDRVRVDHDKKSDGVRVHHEKESDGVRVDHEKKSDEDES